MGGRQIPISRCHCPNCGGIMPIPRKPGRARSIGHKKWLYCPFCNTMVNMTEERDGDVFRNMNGDTLTL